MKIFFVILFLILLSTAGFCEEDTILNCDKFTADIWNPFSWFDDARSDLYNMCISYLEEDTDINTKKLRILSMYNVNPNEFDYDFVDTWNEDLDIEITPDVEDIKFVNKSLIKNAYFIFSAINPAVTLSDQKNSLVIPYNISLIVDFGYEVKEPQNEQVNSFPSYTPKGFCKEEYSIVEDSGRFDLFIDKNKKIGEDLEKSINVNLSEQGKHSLDGLYDIQIKIRADYTQWSEFCCGWDEGSCNKYCHECDEHYKTEILVDQLILTDYKEVIIEQPFMNITKVETTGFNEEITGYVTIEGLNDLQKYNFNQWYIMTNYKSKLNYKFPPINYLYLEALRIEEPRFVSPGVKKLENQFIFKTWHHIKNLSFVYDGFFFNNTQNINLSYKDFSYLNGEFGDLFYSDGDNITFYPFILKEKYRCKNCSILIDNVKLMYGDKIIELDSNNVDYDSPATFIYNKDNSISCINIIYEGDENHYGSDTCVDIPDRPTAIDIIIDLWWLFIVFSLLKIAIGMMLKFKEKENG